MRRILMAAALALTVGACGTSQGFVSPIGEYVYDPAVVPLAPLAPPSTAVSIVPAEDWQVPLD